MNKPRSARALFALSLLSAAFLCSCEHDEVRDKWDDVKEKVGFDDKETYGDVTGTWTGHSGSGQWASRMVLTENASHRISGTMTWTPNNDTRAVSGRRSGKNVTLQVSGGDSWYLVISGDGNKMTGTGDKAGTDRSYALSYTR